MSKWALTKLFWLLALVACDGNKAYPDAGIVADASPPIVSPSGSTEKPQKADDDDHALPAEPTTAAGVFLLGGHHDLDAGAPSFIKPVPITAKELTERYRNLSELSMFEGSWKLPDQRDLEIKILRLKKLEKGSHLSILPILWTPATGKEFLVTTGRTPRATVIAVFRRHGAPEGELVAHMVFAAESAPIVFDYDPVNPLELKWTMCRGCRGEEGTIRYRTAEGSVIIRQE